VRNAESHGYVGTVVPAEADKGGEAGRCASDDLKNASSPCDSRVTHEKAAPSGEATGWRERKDAKTKKLLGAESGPEPKTNHLLQHGREGGIGGRQEAGRITPREKRPPPRCKLPRKSPTTKRMGERIVARGSISAAWGVYRHLSRLNQRREQ